MGVSTLPSEKAFIKEVSGTQQTGTLAANGTKWIDVPFTRPQGYSPISLSRVYVSGGSLQIYNTQIVDAQNIISIAIRNIGTSSASYSVDASVMCIKTS